MTYATQQLAKALQELVARSQGNATYAGKDVPKDLSTEDLAFSQEVADFVASRRAYGEKTRNVSVGTY